MAEAAALEVINSDGLDPVIRLLEALCKTANVPFRRELMSSARRSIKLVIDGEQPDLDSAAWQVQNTARHAGRRLASRSVGSTLLVKGLQFDHAVIVAPERLEINDLYVAMTRASKTITIVSPVPILRAKAKRKASGVTSGASV